MPQKLTPDILGDWEKILLYGVYGTGKTQLAFTAPDPIYALGTGGPNEFKTLYSKKFIEKVGKKEVFFDFVREKRGEQGRMMDNPSGFDDICRAIDVFLEWNDRENPGIKTFVLDNATILEHYMMNKAIAAEYHIGGAGNTDKQVLIAERNYGIRKPHDSTWGGAQSLMDRIVGWLFELDFHIILVAHEHKTHEQKEKSRAKLLKAVNPLFVGEQRTRIPNMFDNVWRCTVSGGGRTRQYNVQTEADEVIAAKTRVGGLLDPNLERDLNLSNVIKLFKEHAAELKKEEEEHVSSL